MKKIGTTTSFVITDVFSLFKMIDYNQGMCFSDNKRKLLKIHLELCIHGVERLRDYFQNLAFNKV